MNFKTIKDAFIKHYEGDLQSFIELFSEDLHCESIHKSSMGNKVKNYDEFVNMVKDVEWASEPIIQCLLETPNIVVKTVDGFDPNFTYLEIDHIQDGKIIKHIYGKVPK